MCLLLACDPGFADCNDDPTDGCERPIDTESDCGGCDITCDLDQATAQCLGGACVIDACTAGRGDCDDTASTGCEQSLDTLEHCGGCDRACSLPRGVTSCVTGTCELVGCQPGWANCDATDSNGCEGDLSSPSTCGDCDTICPSTLPLCAAQGDTFVCQGACGSTGLTECGTSCVDTNTSLEHCGGCNQPCAPMNGMGVCSGGQCLIAMCSGSYEDCDGLPSTGCEERLGTVSSCGGCGMPCTLQNATNACLSGTCAIASCDDGFGDCDGSVDTGCEESLTTLTDCGACGTACSLPNATETCTSGTCELVSCNPNTDDCDGNPANGCEDLLSDPVNCGNCGQRCRGRENAVGVCIDGRCDTACNPGYADCNGRSNDGCECLPAPNAVASCDAGSNCAFTCIPGYTDCDGSPGNGCEINTGGNVDQCGACGVPCPSRPSSTRTCTDGVCGYACVAGSGDCNGEASDGCETPLTANLMHCGACNNACPDRPNSTPVCSTGMCGFSCDPGFADCDGDASNGCEVDLTTSLANCGMCGNICPNRANASRTCTGGICGYDCNAPYDDCDGDPSDGCETNTNSSLANCGTCMNLCPNRSNASRTCIGGSCGYTCAPPWEDCNGSPLDGCERNTDTEILHCGMCDNACPAKLNATLTCTGGSCGYTCLSNFGDCDGVADGCEAALSSDPNNCGMCGSLCPSRSNATTTCASSTCGFSCNTNFGDCDMIASTGCEVDHRTNALHCGSCGNACTTPPQASPTCVGSNCSYTCDPGWTDCNGEAADGCEIHTDVDTTSCGTCGNNCPIRMNANTTCSGGSCGYTCISPWEDCNGGAADGCETPLNTTNDCGACGTLCILDNATADCSTTNCLIGTCDMGWDNCNSVQSDGCETNILSDRQNCGMCGNRCPGGTQCQGGSCA